MRSLFRHLQLRPHGDNLLTSSAAFWLFSARALVFTMATAEAVAWGYLGFLFGEGATRWVGAAFAASVIFLVVWMIDASLITLDRAWREHSEALLGHAPTKDRGALVKSVLTFGIRIALLVGSLTVTAPYLAQVVFYKDIQQFIESEATTNIQTAKRQLSEKYDADLADRSKKIDELRAAFEREVAGKGISGRYGMGAAATAMSQDIAKLTEERNKVAADETAALASLDELTRDWRKNRDELAAKYNLTLPQPSILENRKALDELRKRPENAATELAIKAFLSFIFAGLLLLKLFEPSSIRLYMSDVLQQEYLRYLAGTFDDLLPATENSRVHPSPMSAQRLYEFLKRVWVPRLRDEEREADFRARAVAADRAVKELENLRERVREELAQVNADYRSALERADGARKNLVQLKAAIDVLRGDIQIYNKQLERWAQEEATVRADDESRFERSAVKSDVRQKLADTNRRLEGLLELEPGAQDQVRRADAEVDRWEQRLRKHEEQLASISNQVLQIRLDAHAAQLSGHGPKALTANSDVQHNQLASNRSPEQ